jgi:hypothetical protein
LKTSALGVVHGNFFEPKIGSRVVHGLLGRHKDRLPVVQKVFGEVGNGLHAPGRFSEARKGAARHAETFLGA